MKRRILVTVVAAAVVATAAIVAALGSRPAKHQQQQAVGEYMASPTGGFVSTHVAAKTVPAAQAITIRPSSFDLSPPMRDVHVAPRTGGPTFVSPPEPSPQSAEPGPAGPPSRDPIVERTHVPNVMPATSVNFEGLGNTAHNFPLSGGYVNPPDVEGDVGPSDYVEYDNVVWSVYDKTGVVRAGWPKSNAAIWAGFSNTSCANDWSGDPIVLYDRAADRWLLSEFAITTGASGPWVQCIAVSQTNDPTGAYYRYAYDFTSVGFQDYPHFGVWPDGYYMSVNLFNNATGSATFIGRGAAAFDRTAMLAGAAAPVMNFFNLGTTPPSTLQPTDMEGSTPPLANTPNFFWLRNDTTNELWMYKFHSDYAPAGSPTFTGPTMIPVAAFDASMCGGSSNCVPQPPTVAPHTVDGLDALSGRINNRAVYRRFSDHESIVLNHTVDENSADHAGIRWYELRDPNGSPSVFDSGTYAPDGLHRWMGNANMDANGDIAVGYSVSSSSEHPGIRYAGRLTTDTAGTLGQGEATLQAGVGTFWRGGFGAGGSSRWGDYSAMQVDPTDDCTFWFVHEYMAADTDRDWHTRVGAFKFPTCDAPTAVAGVGRFGATRAKAGAVVRWRSSNEANVLGYHLWRSTNAKTWRRVNLALIPAKAGAKVRGASYRFVDRTARTRGFVNYRLQLVDLSGKRSWYGIGALATS